MMRLPTTTICLTMGEIKEFERHRRFRNYLAKEGAKSRSSSQVPLATSIGGWSMEDASLEPLLADEVIKDQDKTVAEEETILGLSCLRPRLSSKDVRPEDISSHGSSSPTQSLKSSSGSYTPAAWAPHQTPLPPPFSQGVRIVSDRHSLPSVGSPNHQSLVSSLLTRCP
jgi:hypothetical protein